MSQRKGRWRCSLNKCRQQVACFHPHAPSPLSSRDEPAVLPSAARRCSPVHAPPATRENAAAIQRVARWRMQEKGEDTQARSVNVLILRCCPQPRRRRTARLARRRQAMPRRRWQVYASPFQRRSAWYALRNSRSTQARAVRAPFPHVPPLSRTTRRASVCLNCSAPLRDACLPELPECRVQRSAVNVVFTSVQEHAAVIPRQPAHRSRRRRRDEQSAA